MLIEKQSSMPICCYCCRREAEIQYCLSRDGGYRPYCAFCIEHLAYGMLRDAQALIVGEEIAQQNHVDFLKRYREN